MDIITAMNDYDYNLYQSQVQERDMHLISPTDPRYFDYSAADNHPLSPTPSLPPAPPASSASLSELYQGAESQSETQPIGISPISRNGTISAFNTFTIGNGIEIRPSQIQNAGNGAFVTRDVDSGNMFTEYDGEVIDRTEAKRRSNEGKDSHIRSLHPAHTAIDGVALNPNKKGTGAASFVNDPLDSAKANCEWYGTDTFQPFGVERSGLGDMKRQYLRNTRALQKGEELYVSYGNDYWVRHHTRLQSAPILIASAATTAATDTKQPSQSSVAMTASGTTLALPSFVTSVVKGAYASTPSTPLNQQRQLTAAANDAYRAVFKALGLSAASWMDQSN